MSFFKKLGANFLVIFVLFCQIFSQNAYALDTSAKSAILIEAKTGEVLYEKNAFVKLPMASTTKIMTAICAIENVNLDKIITVDKSAVGVEGSSMYLGYGEKITIRNLLYGLMLSSGNDAAVAIAIAVGGDVETFANMMNETATKIGVKSTSFKNPNGLDEKDHYTTAYDLAMITSYGLKNPEFANIVKTNNIKIPWDGKEYDRTLQNHNKMLRIYDGATGVKTGFTKKSGRCLVSSATRNNMDVIAVTLNDGNDWIDHTNMLDYAFNNYTYKKIINKNEFAMTANVNLADTNSARLEFAEDVYILQNNNEKYDISIIYDVKSSLDAPVSFGERVGCAKIIVNEKEYKTLDIITASCVNAKVTKKFSNEFKNIITKYIRGN